MTLYDAVEKLNPRTVAVVGLAKNCGKTTAFNYLLGEYSRNGCGPAVTSAGRDGESEDALTGQPKPAIILASGTLAATAEGTLARWSAPGRIVARMNVESALGEIVLVEAIGEGSAELAGPPSLASVAEAVGELRKLGAGRVLVDGALDRIAVGYPGLSDAVVLAAGAVLASSPFSIARMVAEKVEILRLAAPPRDVRTMLEKAAEGLGSRAAAVSEAGVRRLPETVLSEPNEAAAAARDARWLLCGGAVTYELLEILMAASVEADLVARDATRVFIGKNSLRRWQEAGRKLCVLSPISLAAIVTNPHNPVGSDLDPEELIEEVAARAGDLPVFDVVAGLERNAS